MLELNSEEYIDDKLKSLDLNQTLDDQSPKWLMNYKLSFMTLISGRKWFIFLLISMFPILISVLSGTYLLGSDTPRAAFMDVFMGIFYLLLFGWGALVVSLPLSADEISDNMMDLYIVRPIRRDVFWSSRWLANFTGLFLLNDLIATIYYVYFHAVDDMSTIFSDLDVLVEAFLFMFFATLTYGGLYLFVCSLGDKGFTLGVMLAIFEPYFLSLLFLDSSKYIPRNNLLRLADKIYGSDFTLDGFNNFPKSLDMAWALSYVGIFALIFLIGGALYYRRREFS